MSGANAKTSPLRNQLTPAASSLASAVAVAEAAARETIRKRSHYRAVILTVAAEIWAR